MGETLTEVEYLRRDNRRLRQQCSAEGKEKYLERLKDALRRAEQRELEACAEADELRAKAELYDKLKAFIKSKGVSVGDGDLENIAISEDFDEAVKALPDA